LTTELIRKYFVELSDLQQQRFERLRELYLMWNERINVVSRRDIDYLYSRHVLHSLAIAKIITFVPGTRLLDVGTGGGFPAVPLAIMFPDMRITAADSVGKKIKALASIAEELDLDNLDPLNARAEIITAKFDFVTGRAVTNLPDFIALTKNRVKPQCRNVLPNGVFCFKGGNVNDELHGTINRHSLSQKQITIHHISDFFEEAFFDEKKIVYIQI
jgi:16S rRNA (guanine527-N7)-methyltransferase